MTPQEMHEKRLGIIAKQTELNDRVIAENRDFNGEEQTEYTKMETEQKELKAKADRALALAAAKAEIEQPARAGVRPGVEGGGADERPRASADYKKSFRAWAHYGDARTPVTVTAVLEKAVTTQGGYLVPQDYDTALVKILTNANVMRQLANVKTTTLDTNITFEASLPVAGWIDELGTYPQSDMTFGRKAYGAWKLGVIVKTSEELFNDAFLDIDGLIADEGGRSMGLTEEAAFFAGDGNKKPTGVLVEATGAVTSAAPGTIGFDDILAMIYATPRVYRANGSFVFADSAILSLRKAKTTGSGEYIWQPAQTLGAPDTLYGKPLYTTDALAAVAAGAKSGMFGDFKQYQVLDRQGFSMQRINELYAETGQIGFKLNKRVDGHLLRPDAITVLTQHA